MTIEFVGLAGAAKVGSTSASSTIALDSGLVGGIASAVAAGDLVVAVFGTGSTANRTLSITDGTTEYAAAELYSDDTFDTNLRIGFKFMGGTPDTTTTFGPTGSTADAGAMAVYVFRGVDPTTPLDVELVGGTGIDTSRVVPPDITPITAGAFVVVVGAAAHNGGVDSFTSADLTAFASVGANDTNDVTVGIGHDPNWTSGATNYATWGHSQADSTSFSWAAITLALRPAITGTGALAAGAAAVDGAGLSLSTGSGALVAQAAQVAADGVSGSIGAGTLVAQASAVDGAGVSESTGTGALVAQPAQITGSQVETITGVGTLVASPASISGVGGVADVASAGGAATRELLRRQKRPQYINPRMPPEPQLPVLIGIGFLASQAASISGIGSVGPGRRQRTLEVLQLY